ncbi:caspase family protein [Rhizobium leguminosarum]|uniref:caspase family protein n=1 Tax=Rhizobium leguminosarum TaxID=384 RepID=UPI001C919A3D|nr:caspase family protein [Rhizobium leguminosarum]MBY2985685.1 hypothetical protein [Rhizobium leguminosarum]
MSMYYCWAVRFFVLFLRLSVIAVAVHTLSVTVTAAEEDAPGVHAEIVQQIGHTTYVYAVAFSPDQKLAISAGGDTFHGGDNTLRLWSVGTGKLLRTFRGHTDQISAVAFSPDGRSVLSGSSDTTLRLWDVSSGKEVRTFAGHTRQVTSVALSPDGRVALSGSVDDTVKLWDIETGKEIRSLEDHSKPVLSVAFSHDGKSFLSASSDKTIRLWDAASGRSLRTLKGHWDKVYSAVFSPDDQRILSGSFDGMLRLWDVGSGRTIRTFKGHTGAVTSVALSPDGKLALSSSGVKMFSGKSIDEEGDNVRLWDVETGRQIRGFKGHRASYGSTNVSSVAFSSDGTLALTGAWDMKVKLWEVSSGREIRSFGGDSLLNLTVNAVAISPDGVLVLTGNDDGSASIWDLQSPGNVRTLKGHSASVTAVSFSPDGSRALTGSSDKTLKLWDVASGSEIRTFVGHSASVSFVAYEKGGTSALSAGQDGLIKRWDVSSGKELRSLGHVDDGQKMDGDRIMSAALSPDGRFLLAGIGDKSLNLWDLNAGKVVRTFKGHATIFDHFVTSIAFLPDGKQALSTSVSMDSFASKVMILWDIASGKQIRSFSGHTGGVYSVAVSPDGAFAVSAGDDHTTRRWSLVSGDELGSYDAGSAELRSIAISPDGHRIVTVGGQGTVSVWNVGGELLATQFNLKGGERLTITPEGFFDATPKAATMLTLVHGVESYSIDQVYDQLYRPDLVSEKLDGDPKGLVRTSANRINLDVALTSGAPPQLGFVDPPPTTSTQRVNISVDVSNRGGGIGKIEWRLNGVTIGLDGRGLARVDQSSQPRRFDRELLLVPGENLVEVVAYNEGGIVASSPISTTIIFNTDEPPQRAKLYVMAIGINDYYDSRLALNYAVPDAKSIAVALQKASGELYADVIITLVLDQDVTFEGIDSAFREIGKGIGPQDTFVLFVAGHGKTVDGRYYYIPRNFRYRDKSSFTADAVGQDRFQQWLANIPAQRSILLFDTCESGSLTQDQPQLRGLERAVAVEKMTAAMGRTTIAASTDAAPALEGYRGHGVFTYAILQGLGSADGDGNGNIDVLEMISYLDRTVPELSDAAFRQRQIPQAKFSGSNFIFARQSTPDAAMVVEPAPTQSAQPKPSHVVILDVDVRSQAGGSETVARLHPGVIVSIVRAVDGWVLVARDGEDVGFVPKETLAEVQ